MEKEEKETKRIGFWMIVIALMIYYFIFYKGLYLEQHIIWTLFVGISSNLILFLGLELLTKQKDYDSFITTQFILIIYLICEVLFTVLYFFGYSESKITVIQIFIAGFVIGITLMIVRIMDTLLVVDRKGKDGI